MKVSEIVSRVAEFALDETDSQTILQARIVADLNAVYQEVVQSAADNDNDNLLSQEGTLVNGSITITDDFTLIASVRNITNNTSGYSLTRTDIIQLEDQYGGILTDTGSPRWYYVSGKTVNAYPKGTGVTVRVRYYPKPNILTYDSLEADIKMPAMFHQVLVDGCIWYMKQREQGFHDQNDRGEIYQKYQQGIKDYLLAVEARTRGVRRTVTYDF